MREDYTHAHESVDYFFKNTVHSFIAGLTSKLNDWSIGGAWRANNDGTVHKVLWTDYMPCAIRIDDGPLNY